MAEVFGASASVGLCRIGDAQMAELHPCEGDSIRNAIDHRRQEFAAGRKAARIAIGQNVAIDVAPDRAPIWPSGIVGSISHDTSWACAVVHREAKMVGLDVEDCSDLPQEIWDTVLSASEAAWCRAQPQPGLIAKAIFSIKEACYKAQYPLTKTIFGFEMFQVALSGDAFQAVFQSDVGPFAKGDRLAGKLSIGPERILSGVLVL